MLLLYRKGQLSVAKYLLESGASTEIADLRDLNTPLHAAAASGHFFVVDLLLEFGADPTKRNAVGLTALQLAEAGRHQETVYLLAKPEYLAPVEGDEDAR